MPSRPPPEQRMVSSTSLNTCIGPPWGGGPRRGRGLPRRRELYIQRQAAAAEARRAMSLPSLTNLALGLNQPVLQAPQQKDACNITIGIATDSGPACGYIVLGQL
mmetsp:Transcript_52814/g.148756  ORF Transcript_52814/g.148756 Transcript_52814/m.148756 type:complete len:105 (-) Transcript_52814:64-378(-)